MFSSNDIFSHLIPFSLSLISCPFHNICVIIGIYHPWGVQSCLKSFVMFGGVPRTSDPFSVHLYSFSPHSCNSRRMELLKQPQKVRDTEKKNWKGTSALLVPAFLLQSQKNWKGTSGLLVPAFLLQSQKTGKEPEVYWCLHSFCSLLQNLEDKSLTPLDKNKRSRKGSGV